MTTITIVRIALCLCMVGVAPVSARQLDLTLPRSSTPIVFPAGDDGSGDDTRPAGDYDRNGLDTRHDGSGLDVSGSVTTGIGYTKGYGNSRFSSAHLRVAHDDDDARPSRFHLDIDVGTSRGPAFIGPYGDDGGLGGYENGDGGFDAFRADGSPGGSGDFRERGRR